MARPKVTVSRRLPAAVEQQLQERYDITLNAGDDRLSADALAVALDSSDALVSTLGDPISADLLGRCRPRAQIIAHFGVGYDNIDVTAARTMGITVTNTPGVLTEDTADLTIALLLASARRMSEGDRELRAGNWTGWRPTHLLGTRLSGKRLGLVGFGRIAQAVARRARLGFGMQVHAWSRSLTDDVAAQHGIQRIADLDDLLGSSDFVSLHVPGNADTLHLIDAARLARIPAHAHLVNTARGSVVDQEALIDALTYRRIAGAGLDVFEHEPAVPAELLALPNVCAIPHMASATVESRTAMGMLVIENLDAFFAGQQPPNRVN
ncbi:MAG: D-glycerate dehydrogenase [Gemmatimonadetes bacterium]|nr:D-glycerate dehydrogenase [Gemmatimonadota bacterium]